MKKISVFPSLLISTVCVLGLMTCVVSAQTYTNGDWTYVSGNGSATITQYSGTASRVIIPATFGTLPVTRIGDYALSGNTNVTQIIIPNGVLSFGHAAFLYCPQLTHVSIPNSVTDIGSAAFWDCTNLDSVYIPESVQSIGNSAFLNCTSLTHVYFGGNVPVQVSFLVFDRAPATIYYTTNSSGWATSFAERPTQTYSLPSSDIDRDGVTHYRELADGTNPNDPSSFNPLSKGLVAYYPFDGNANDESGYGNNGTTTSVTFSPNRFGVDSSAISFAQDPSYVTTEVGALPVGAQSRTISFWARPNTLPISPMPAAVSYGTTTSGGNAFGVGIGADATPYFWGHGVDIEVVGSNTVNQRQWVQLVASLDSSGTLSVFQDGQLVARKPNSGLNTTSSGLLVGRWRLQNFEGFTCQFDGAIDQLRVYSRAFSESEVAQLFYAEAFTTAERSFITSNPSLIGHYSQAEYQLNRTNGQIDVTTNPSAFNLFTQEEFNSNRTAGQSDVISNPMSYGLYTSNSIMDLRMGGLMIQRQGTNAVVSFQPQTTTDLTQPFTNNGTPITNTIPMPGNKGFIRINAKP